MKRIKILLIAGTALILSCDFSSEFESVCMDCRCSDSTVRGQWVQDCVKNGNNMSDEEMEDVVKACVLASESLFCEPSRCVKSRGNQGRLRWLEEPECGKLKIDIRVDSLRSVAEDIKKCDKGGQK
ncbi:MAG: hypothetical protein WC554_07650 [Clostridia bacterium]|jgi:hypothetical protein